LLELGLQLEDELSLVEETLLSIELCGAVLVCFVEIVVDVVSEGELGFAKGGAGLVKAGASIVALAARFGEGGIGCGSAVTLLAFAVFIVDSICAALQALYVSFKPSALGFALGSLESGGLHEFLVGVGPLVQEGIPFEQCGGEEVGGKAVGSEGGSAGCDVDVVPNDVFAAPEFDAGDVELLLEAGGAPFGPGDGITGGDATREDVEVESTTSAGAVISGARGWKRRTWCRPYREVVVVGRRDRGRRRREVNRTNRRQGGPALAPCYNCGEDRGMRRRRLPVRLVTREGQRTAHEIAMPVQTTFNDSNSDVNISTTKLNQLCLILADCKVKAASEVR
jgi:hypothetical protein